MTNGGDVMNESLNKAVGALLSDRRLVRRFRRNPERALRRFGLAPAQVDALKRGDAAELLALGVDPAYVWPKTEADAVFRRWLLLNPRRLAPVAFAVAAIAAFPAAATAAYSARRSGPRARIAARRLARRALRPAARYGLRRRALARALRLDRVAARQRALRRIAGRAQRTLRASDGLA
jgi:hypothetical protein